MTTKVLILLDQNLKKKHVKLFISFLSNRQYSAEYFPAVSAVAIGLFFSEIKKRRRDAVESCPRKNKEVRVCIQLEK